MKPENRHPIVKADTGPPKVTKTSELHIKEEVFCEEYCKDFNARAAYQRSGYTDNKGTVRKVYALLKKPNVREKIIAILKERAADKEEVIDHLSFLSRSSLEDFLKFDKRGEFIGYDLKKAKEAGKLGYIRKISVHEWTDKAGVEHRQIKVSVWDPMPANDRLARFHGLYPNLEEQPADPDGKDTNDLIASFREREIHVFSKKHS